MLISFYKVAKDRQNFLNYLKLNRYFVVSIVLYTLLGTLSYFQSFDLKMYQDHAILNFYWILILPFLYQIKKYKKGKCLLHCMMVGVIITGFMGVLYLFGVTSYLGHWASTTRYAPSSSGVIMSGDLCSLFFSISLLLFFKEKKYFYLLVCFFALIATIVSGTKTALIVLLLSILFLAYEKKLYKNIKFMAICLLLIPFLFFGKGKQLVERFSQDLMSLTQQNLMDDSKSLSSLTYRVYTCDVAWKIFLKNPIFGTGIGDFYIDKEDYINKGELREDFRHTHDAHNEYLETLSTLGLLGLLSLLAIYFTAMFNKPNIYVVIIVCSYLVFGLTAPVLKNKWGLVVFLFLINHFGLHYKEQASINDEIT
ncbi:MAG: hypothetical protein COB02_14610 [Candidatus Cloacimonadota bacterium]|nr:MAG: hypothetical protein COB02_14610 [Candidatus Cloacimonadota bacterium]